MTTTDQAYRDRQRARNRTRAHYRALRRALDLERQLANAEAATRAVLASGLMHRLRRCGLYFSQVTEGEIDTLPLLSRLWAAGKTVACPVVGSRGEMDFYQVTPRTALSQNRYGIPEPRTRGALSGRYLKPLSLDVLFMPLVAFDEQGNRLGMGAGYYDRFLGRLPQAMRPLTVGLAHEIQRAPEGLEQAPWDAPLDAVATEAGWQAFSRRAMVLASMNV